MQARKLAQVRKQTRKIALIESVHSHLSSDVQHLLDENLEGALVSKKVKQNCSKTQVKKFLDDFYNDEL